MPLHATQAILVDIVAPVEELPANWLHFWTHSSNRWVRLDSKNRTSLEKLSSYFEKRQVMIFYYIKNDSNASHRRRKGIHQLDSTQDYVRFYRKTLMKFSYFSKSY
jgi:two-component system CheB/CheR fusion protein